MGICEKCLDGVFKHYISLGHSCFIAEELEDLGLRDSSYPFDWVYSPLDGVIRAIKTNFDGFLDYDKLYQKELNPHVYKNRDYMISFPHDFSKYKPLKKQIKAVREKYSRRIARFYKNIQEPTLFFRYCEDISEVSDLREKYSILVDLLKSFNKENELIVIVHDHLYDNQLIISNLYEVHKDLGEKLTHHPLTQNSQLYTILKNAVFDKKDNNLAFTAEKRKNKAHHTWKKQINRILEKHKMVKIYYHNKKY